jgi:hypothetical protein
VGTAASTEGDATVGRVARVVAAAKAFRVVATAKVGRVVADPKDVSLQMVVRWIEMVVRPTIREVGLR